jgi:hypothetical protein
VLQISKDQLTRGRVVSITLEKNKSIQMTGLTCDITEAVELVTVARDIAKYISIDFMKDLYNFLDKTLERYIE